MEQTQPSAKGSEKNTIGRPLLLLHCTALVVLVVRLQRVTLCFPLLEPISNPCHSLRVLSNAPSLRHLNRVLYRFTPNPLRMCLSALTPLQLVLPEVFGTAIPVNLHCTQTCERQSACPQIQTQPSPLSSREVSTTWPRWNDIASVTCSSLGLIMTTSPTWGWHTRRR